MILNLKKIDKFINKKLSKWSPLITLLLNVLRTHAWMASIDFKDVFFSVPVSAEHKSYLKFLSIKLYKFDCMPNGSGPTMSIFTKLTKLVTKLTKLVTKLSKLIVYVDDSHLQGNIFHSCLQNVKDTS